MKFCPPSQAVMGLLCALAAMACDDSKDPPVTGGDGQPGDSQVLPGDGDPPLVCSGSSGHIRVATAGTLSPLIEAPERCLLYAADRTADQVYFIDTITDSVRHAVSVGNQPTDLVLSADGSLLFVAVFGERKLVGLDAQTSSVVYEVTTEVAPYRLVAGGGNRIFYVGREEYTELRQVNIGTQADTVANDGQFFEPDLAGSPDGATVYVAEGNLAGARLLRLDATADDLPLLDSYVFDGGFGRPTPDRQVYLNPASGRVYYADRAFSADNVQRVRGWLGATALAGSPDGGIVATLDSLHDTKTFATFATRPHPGETALFSADGAWLYEFEAVGSLLHRTPVDTLLGVHRLGQTSVPPGSLAQHTFVQILADPQRNLLYALDSQQNQLVYIDADTLLPLRAEVIGSAPTDMELSPDGDSLAIATFGATELAMIDLTDSTKTVKWTVSLPNNPFKIAVSAAGTVAYVEQDQLTDIGLVNLATGELLGSLESSLFQPDVVFNADGTRLYLSESAGPESRLRLFDVQSSFTEIAVSDDHYSYPSRRVILRGDHVYYAGHKFNAATLEELGRFDDDIVLVTPDGRYAVSSRLIFDTTTYAEVGGLPIDSQVIASDPSGTRLFQFDNSTGTLFVQALPPG